MNTPSPLVPQGTTPSPRRRSHLTAVFVILVFHVGALGLLLLQGCKKETEAAKAPVEATPSPTFGADAGASNAVPAGLGSTNGSGITGLPTPPPGVPAGALPPAGLVPPPLPTGGAPAPGGVSPVSGISPLPPAGGLPPAVPAGGGPVSSATDSTVSTPAADHTVMKGETLGSIAKKYNMGWKAIAAANPGVDATKLKVGQKLVIPARSVSPASGGHADAAGAGDSGAYTVKSGDTLAKIAKGHSVSVKALKAANGLKLDKISVGQKLKIPGKAAPAPAPVVETPAPAAAPFSPPPVNPGLVPAPEPPPAVGSPSRPQ